MFKIGLSGGFGSGKTTAAAMFKRHGAKVIDADAITRGFLTANRKYIKKVAKIFPGVILNSGGIDRAKLAKVVFQNPRELKKLTDVLYPEALKEVKRRIFLYKRTPWVILDVPLLFEAGWDRLTDATIVVRASRRQQIQRIQKRMRISKAEILRRLQCQMPLKQKCILADFIIDNRGSLKDTRRQVGAIMHRLIVRRVPKSKERTA